MKPKARMLLFSSSAAVVTLLALQHTSLLRRMNSADDERYGVDRLRVLSSFGGDGEGKNVCQVAR